MNNKFYIGSTCYLKRELKYMFNNKEKNNKWINVNKPLYIEDIIYPDNDQDIEHNVLLTYVKKYGINNVRGSTFDWSVWEELFICEQ